MKENRIIESVKKKINDMKEFSGVIKINKTEKVIYEKAYGFADISNERLNNIIVKKEVFQWNLLQVYLMF